VQIRLGTAKRPKDIPLSALGFIASRLGKQIIVEAYSLPPTQVVVSELREGFPQGTINTSSWEKAAEYVGGYRRMLESEGWRTVTLSPL